MKKCVLILTGVVLVVLSFVLGGVFAKNKEEKIREVQIEWSEDLSIQESGLIEKCTAECALGNSEYDYSNSDFSFLIERMQYFTNEGYEFKNIGLLMSSAGVKVTDVNDAKKSYNEFARLSDEDKNKVLSKMYKKIGNTTYKGSEFDYVPTGEKTEDGKDITQYQKVGEKEITIPEYVRVMPLEISHK